MVGGWWLVVVVTPLTDRVEAFEDVVEVDPTRQLRSQLIEHHQRLQARLGVGLWWGLGSRQGAAR